MRNRKIFVNTILILALVFLLFAAAVPAFADGPNTPGANASPSGQSHMALASVNGPFGWLGDLGGTPGYHNAVGQESGATGSNNCQVIGQCADHP